MNRVTIYTTGDEWRDLIKRTDLLLQARDRAREQAQRTVVIRLGRNGPIVATVINHGRR